MKRVNSFEPSDYPHIPNKAFLFAPTLEQQIVTENAKENRIIFDGGVAFTSKEKARVAALKQEMQKKQKNEPLKIYSDNVLVRFLQANQFNNTNTIHALRDFKQWQEKHLPLKLSRDVEELLKQGILYMSGRDCCFRPILVVNVGKILKIAPKQEVFFDTLAYFFQFVIENCLIEGQVENWVSIIDLGNASVFSLGGTLVDTITYLSSNFRARVHRSFLINAPSSIKWVWGMVKGAMNEDQLKKLSLSSKAHLVEEDFSEINKLQVERKYGGERPEIESHWPLLPCEEQIEAKRTPELVQFITVEEYNEKFNRGELNGRKVNKGLLDRAALVVKSCKSIMSKSHSEEDHTRSDIDDDLEELNLRIPKEQQPQTIHVVPEPHSLRDILDKLVTRVLF